MIKKIRLLALLFAFSFVINCQSASQENANAGKVEVIGNNWIITLPPPSQNSTSPRNTELRFLKETNHPTIVQDVTPESTSIELSNVEGFPPAGKIYTFAGETIGYSSIAGSTLQGLNRAQEGTISVNHKAGQAAYLITMQREMGDKAEFQTPQLPDSYYIHHRWMTNSRDNGNNGWSGFEMLGFAQGSETPGATK